MKLYQPEFYFDDGTNIEYLGIPDDLGPQEVFSSKKRCKEWLKEHNYQPSNFIITEKKDIENPIIL